eukprot:1931298-Rhodomonas_salina.2
MKTIGDRGCGLMVMTMMKKKIDDDNDRWMVMFEEEEGDGHDGYAHRFTVSAEITKTAAQ